MPAPLQLEQNAPWKQRFSQAVPQLYIYDLERDSLEKLAHPAYGFIGSALFGPDGTLYAACDDATHPSRFVSLDEKTGEQVRVVLASAEPTARTPSALGYIPLIG